MPKPIFTVVMATLNAVSLIGRTIDSLRRQDVDAWELYVIDGASSDGTLAVAHAYADSRICVVSEPDKGIADAWNKGIRMSGGDWLIFLGAGDSLPSNALRRIAEAIPPDSGPCVIYGDTALVKSEQEFELIYGRPLSARGPRLGFPFLHPSCATSRLTFSHVGLFNEEVRIAIDSDFLLRAWQSGASFIKADHTAVMLAGGVSDRCWIEANLEYTERYAHHTGASQARRLGLRLGVRLRSLVFRTLGLGPAIRAGRRMLVFAVVASVNTFLRATPTFTLRRLILRVAGCQIHSTATIHRGVRLFSLGRIRVGAHSTINRGVYLDNRRPIEVGSNVSIAHDSRLYTLGHDINDPFFKLRGGRVSLEDRVCVFAAAIILPRVTLGEGAVVYPGTVVMKDLPPFSTVRPVTDVQTGVRSTDLRYRIDNAVWLAT